MPAEYTAPLQDIRFVLDHSAGLDRLIGMPAFADLDSATVGAVLEECARFARNVIAPTNWTGDQEGSVAGNGVVRTPTGFKEAYRQFREGGWNGVPFDPAVGGGGLPWAVAMATQEMITSGNMAFALCPLLTQGAVEAVTHHGSDEQKATYLEKLVSGVWTGTMNLTEPQAGSDVGALKSRAVPAADGSWRITGTKIFITYGEHDMAENIVHLVLARTPGSPPGTKGISLFIVPKFIPDADGSPGERNDLRVVSLEHKLGIHASPTCVMSFGDDGGAKGWLLGHENEGMRCMFTMMNNARLSVGLQGLAIAERAYQQALAYARDRRQGRPIGHPASEEVPIIRHPLVQRKLMLMKVQIEAMRALIYRNAAGIDLARHHPDPDVRAREQALVDLFIPMSKAWSTDLGVDLSSLGVQIHGGMGFIEETGAAQYYRDARIAPIYEGTNGIQAIDLVLRKLPMQGGAVVAGLLAEMRALDAKLAAAGQALAPMREALARTVATCDEAGHFLLNLALKDPNCATAAAAPYLRLLATTVGGWLLAQQALVAHGRLSAGDDAFMTGKIKSARFYAQQVLAPAVALLSPILAAGEDLDALDAA